VIYKNPDIIIFDEATNSLDANNEKVIVENLSEFLKARQLSLLLTVLALSGMQIKCCT